MKNSNSSTSGGLSVLSVLGIVFVTLKLCDVIDWSWWYVLMPFYLPIAIAILILGICILIQVVASK